MIDHDPVRPMKEGLRAALIWRHNLEYHFKHGTGPDPGPAPEWVTEGRALFEAVPIEVYETTAEGTMKFVRRRRVVEILSDLNARIKAEGLEFDESSFHIWCIAPENLEWPEGRVCVFPVTGGSEGHYVHIEVALQQHGYSGIIADDAGAMKALREARDELRGYSYASARPWGDEAKKLRTLADACDAAAKRTSDLTPTGKLQLISTCKTFRGWDFACLLANTAGRLLGA